MTDDARRSTSAPPASPRRGSSDDRRAIIARTAVFLAEWWQPGAGLEDGIAVQWADVLDGLPPEAVDRAMTEWLRDGPRDGNGRVRRPGPGEIRDRAAPAPPPRGKGRATAFDPDVELARMTPACRAAHERNIEGFKKWLGIPGLRRHAVEFYDRWGWPDGTKEDAK